jgi:pimeloyl-ACP methyl ester carboxylesterase
MRNFAALLLTSLYLLLCVACSDNSDNPVTVTRDVHTTRCISDVAAADRHEFLCDGVQFKVLLTQDCIDRACGLIFDVHGWLSNPDEQEGRSHLARIAKERGGYIVIQPGELSLPSNWDPVVHYDVVFDFLQQAIDAFDADEDRVHFTGFSQGGRMTWHFVCTQPDLIASAAPLSATDIDCFADGNGPARPVPLFFISGTKDVLVGYFASRITHTITEILVSIMYDYGMVSVDADAYAFAPDGDIVYDDTGRIDTAREDVAYATLDGSPDGPYWWTRYTNTQGVDFEHLRHTNGHVYPDNPDSLIIPEDPSVPFSIGDAIFDFFVRHPRTH